MAESQAIWKLTAYLFSGRKNPEWKLNARQQTTWLRLWGEALPVKAEKPRQPILGYNGLRLEEHAGSYWEIVQSQVIQIRNEERVIRSDADHALENFLLHTAPPDIQELLMQMKLI